MKLAVQQPAGIRRSAPSWLYAAGLALFVLSSVWSQAAEKRPRVVDGNSNAADLRESVNGFFREPVYDPARDNPCLAIAAKYLGLPRKEVEAALLGLRAKYRYHVSLNGAAGATTLSFFFRSKSRERLIEWQEDLLFSYDDTGHLTRVERGAGARRIIQQGK